MEPSPVRGGRIDRTGEETVACDCYAVVQATSFRRNPAGLAKAPP